MTNKLAEEIIDGHSLFQKMVTKEEVANAMEAYHKAKLAEITDEDIRGWAHKLPETYKSINSKGEDVSMFKTKNIAMRAAFIACAIIGAKALRNGEIKHIEQ